MTSGPFPYGYGHKNNILNLLTIHLPAFSYLGKSQVKFPIFKCLSFGQEFKNMVLK